VTPNRPRIGDPAASIDTPALVVDLDTMERNLQAMATFVRVHGLRLRPHAKTHKCAAIARLQMEAGAVGVCVQKVGEAEALAEGGVADIFISNEVIAPAKLARLAALARRVKLAVAVDSVLGIERLAAALHAQRSSAAVFVEIDVGQGRCGVAPPEAGSLARQVVAHGLPFAGLQACRPAGLPGCRAALAPLERPHRRDRPRGRSGACGAGKHRRCRLAHRPGYRGRHRQLRLRGRHRPVGRVAVRQLPFHGS